MDATAWSGLGLALLAGVLSGASPAPLKAMRSFRFEHWSLVSVVAGQLALPWAAAWALCPDLGRALSQAGAAPLLTANALSAAWGVAAVLYGLCLVRIGFGLTVGLLTGIGLPIGAILPLALRGSGGFADAPGPLSPAGLSIAGATALMLLAVWRFAAAGLTRDGVPGRAGSGLRAGLAMAVGAGVLQVGLALAFVYTQGPIGDALRAHGAGAAAAGIGVWAATLPGGAVVGVVFACRLLTRHRSWGIFRGSARDWGLSLAIGTAFFLFLACLGGGMVRLGALGASLGFGLYQIAQLGTAQAIGLLSGEWQAAPAQARRLLWQGIALAVVAVVVMAAGRWIDAP